MISIDKLIDKLFASSQESAALMAAGKMSAAVERLMETGRIGGLLATHPDVEEMSLAAQEKLARVEEIGAMLTAKFNEHGIVQ